MCVQISAKSTSLRAACQISAPRVARHPIGLRMQEDGAAAAVAETSTEEDAALKKTNIAKNKGGRGGGAKKNEKPLSEYSVGSTVEGKIINIMPYGAFVDIGATTDGLVHVSQV